MGANGLMVASSTNDTLLEVNPNDTSSFKLKSAADLADERIVKTYRVLLDNAPGRNLSNLPSTGTYDVSNYLFQHKFYQDAYGISMYLVLGAPRSDYIGEVEVVERDLVARLGFINVKIAIASVAVFVICLALAITLTLVILSRPLSILSRAMKDATNFDFSLLKEGKLTLSSVISELSEMEHSFLEMMKKFAQALQQNKWVSLVYFLSLQPQKNRSAHGPGGNSGRRSTSSFTDSRGSVVGFPPLPDKGYGRDLVRAPGSGSSKGKEKTLNSIEQEPSEDLGQPRSRLSAEEIEYYKEAFNLFDKDHNGCIDIDELREVFVSLDIPHTKDELKSMIAKVDVDNTDTIDMDEFLIMIEHCCSFSSMRSEKQVREAFEVMDSDKNGFISAADIIAVITSLGEELSGEEALEMIKHGDIDGDGQVNFDDFKKNYSDRDRIATSALNSSSNDLFRHRNKRRDDAIRKKVEQEYTIQKLSRKTKRSSMISDRGAKRPSKSGTVSSLRPAAAITVLESARIVQAAQLMAAKRADAVLAVTEEGQLSGILTDKDIAYRVVAEGLDSRTTTVAQVMTRNPISVNDKGSRNEALNIMVARRFRHLPVIAANEEEEDEFDDGSTEGGAPHSTTTGGGGTNVVGLLDITKCVFERLDDLERKVNEDANIVAAMEVLERRGTVASDHVDVIKAQHGCPDLASVLSRTHGDDVPEVGIKASVRDAARVMKDFHQTAILVLSAGDGDDRLGGIFTTKDIVLRVIAAGLDPATTSVTPHPDSVPSSFTILDALKKLNVGHYLHLPVVDSGAIVGLVDVLTLTMAMLEYLLAKDGGADVSASGADSGPMWNKFWNSTFAGSVMDTESDLYTNDDARSVTSANAYHGHGHGHGSHQQTVPPGYVPAFRASPPPAQSPRSQVGRRDHDAASSVAPQSTAFSYQNSDDLRFGFKLKDSRSNKVFRFTSSSSDLSELLSQVKSKTGITVSGDDAPGSTRISYEDDEGDVVHLSTDRDLEDAVAMAKKAGWTKLSLVIGVPAAAPAADGSGERGLPGNQALVSASGSNALQRRIDETPSVLDFLKEAPLPVNVALSAGIVLITAYIVSRLQRL
ncbi:hypothetical protein HDU96_008750 [Phlyctochytrium bullatum]|nr:hypothetical protein HDU96_008750 [Phlyctochytrium bullatum]